MSSLRAQRATRDGHLDWTSLLGSSTTSERIQRDADQEQKSRRFNRPYQARILQPRDRHGSIEFVPAVWRRIWAVGRCRTRQHRDVAHRIPNSGGPNRHPSATCEPDLAQFTGALESMGFSHRTRYGEHGRRISEIFWRQEISVEVAPYRAFSDNGEPLGPACVRTVRVR